MSSQLPSNSNPYPQTPTHGTLPNSQLHSAMPYTRHPAFQVFFHPHNTPHNTPHHPHSIYPPYTSSTPLPGTPTPFQQQHLGPHHFEPNDCFRNTSAENFVPSGTRKRASKAPSGQHSKKAKNKETNATTITAPTHTAAVVGVGAIPASSSSVSGADNTKLFRTKVFKTGRGSHTTATDVWYNIRPVSEEKITAPLPPLETFYDRQPDKSKGAYLACRLCP
jgi:hypothetical protein